MTDVSTAAGQHPSGGLLDLMREDVRSHYGSWVMPGLHALLVHRVGVWAAQQPLHVRVPVGILYKVLNTLVRNVYGVEIARSTVIGRRLRIGHHQGVVLGFSTVIGDDCLIRQGVTLGKATDDARTDDQPTVGNGVHFGAGATVVGPVRIGDGARIGPGAVVTTHVPAGATAFAPPARILRARGPGSAGPAPVDTAGDDAPGPGRAAARSSDVEGEQSSHS